jgi:hypothetical protein
MIYMRGGWLWVYDLSGALWRLGRYLMCFLMLENSESRGTADTAASATKTEQIEARNPSRIIISKTVWALGYVGKTVHLDHIGRFSSLFILSKRYGIILT